MTAADEYTRAAMALASVQDVSDIDVLGQPWTLLPDVFNPGFFVSTAIFDSLLDYPVGGSFLEVGCGAGVIAVRAALAGCAEVWATDINPAAVANASLNAQRHHVSTLVTTRTSDLFEQIPEERTFDVVFWNSNFVHPAQSAGPLSHYERAFFDPGYENHERFMRDGLARLRPGGRLLMGFSDLGDTIQLERCLRAAELSARTIGAVRAADGYSYTLQLLSRRPAHE